MPSVSSDIDGFGEFGEDAYITQLVDGARFMAISPATEHQCHMTGTKLYYSVTGAHVCEQLAHSRYMKVRWTGVEATMSCSQVRLNISIITSIIMQSVSK